MKSLVVLLILLTGSPAAFADDLVAATWTSLAIGTEDGYSIRISTRDRGAYLEKIQVKSPTCEALVYGRPVGGEAILNDVAFFHDQDIFENPIDVLVIPFVTQQDTEHRWEFRFQNCKLISGQSY